MHLFYMYLHTYRSPRCHVLYTIEFNIIILTGRAQYMVYHNKVVSCIFHITITLKYWFVFCGFVISRILPLKNSCTHLQADNRLPAMPRGPLDILKQVLGMHAQVVTEPSLATSGQLTIVGYYLYHDYTKVQVYMDFIYT